VARKRKVNGARKRILFLVYVCVCGRRKGTHCARQHTVTSWYSFHTINYTHTHARARARARLNNVHKAAIHRKSGEGERERGGEKERERERERERARAQTGRRGDSFPNAAEDCGLTWEFGCSWGKESPEELIREGTSSTSFLNCCQWCIHLRKRLFNRVYYLALELKLTDRRVIVTWCEPWWRLQHLHTYRNWNQARQRHQA